MPAYESLEAVQEREVVRVYGYAEGVKSVLDLRD